MSQYKVGDRIIMHKAGYCTDGPVLKIGTIVDHHREGMVRERFHAVRFDGQTYEGEDFHHIKEDRFRLLTKLDKALK